MTPTSVGMRCPECARERTKVRTARNFLAEPTVTYAIIAINVAVFVISSIAGGGLAEVSLGGGTINQHGWLDAPDIATNHEYWRLVTSAFLHAGILHVGFNMLLVFFIGRIIEPVIGHWQFLALYVVGIFAGAAGALVFSPLAATVGASGAAFALMGGTLIISRERGGGLDQQLLLLIGLNLLFSLRPGISIGGHIGGLIGGLLAGFVIVHLGERRRQIGASVAACAGLTVVAVAVCVVAAQAGLP
jgi:membrane associated rhomboid family serine protease